MRPLYEEWTRYLQSFKPSTATQRPPDGLYNAQRLATPLHGWDALDEAAHARLDVDGFVVVRGAYSEAQLLEAETAVAALFRGESSAYAPAPWGRKYGVLLKDDMTLDDLAHGNWQDVLVLARGMVPHDRRLLAIANAAGLVHALQRAMGDQPQLMHSMLRAKPGSQGDKPWHQDLTHFNVDPRYTAMTAWIALDDISLNAGCLYFIPGSHRCGPVRHVFERDYQVPDVDVPRCDQVATPVLRGDCVLFNALTVHGSPPNIESSRRVALQLTFMPTTAPMITDEQRVWQFAGRSLLDLLRDL